MLSALFLDLDNTLIDRDAAFQRVLNAYAPENLHHPLIAEDQHGRGDRRRFLATWHELVGEKLDAATFGQRIAEEIAPDSHLNEALLDFARRVPVGIITNGGTTTQRLKWQQARLDSIIPAEQLWISEELGVAKPDPAIFETACQDMGISPAQALMVGDDPLRDRDGAEKAGLRSLLVEAPIDAEFVCQTIFPLLS